MTFICQQVYKVIDRFGLDCDPEIYHVLHLFLTSPDSLVAREVERIRRGDGGLTSSALRFIYDNHVQASIDSEEQFASMRRARGSLEAIRNSAEDCVDLCAQLEDGETAEEANKVLSQNLVDIIRHANALEHELTASQNAIFTDPLTGIWNRRYLEAELATGLSHPGHQYYLALLDIDHFKRVNDKHGHIVGDQVLKLVAAEIKRLIRDDDVLCRYGGEEFAILFHNVSKEDCIEIVERVRIGVAKHKLVSRRKRDMIGSVTLSAGLAQVEAGDDFDTAVDRADRLLYEAKQQGRDRIAY